MLTVLYNSVHNLFVFINNHNSFLDVRQGRGKTRDRENLKFYSENSLILFVVSAQPCKFCFFSRENVVKHFPATSCRKVFNEKEITPFSPLPLLT